MRGILFLDFDGVLHPESGLGSTVHFCLISHLHTLLRERDDIDVVVSSTWRLDFPFDVILDFLTCDGGEDLANRIIGLTPEHPDFNAPGHRGRECRAWLRENGFEGAPWVAVDDRPEWFSNDDNLIPVDPNVGIDSDFSSQVSKFIPLKNSLSL